MTPAQKSKKPQQARSRGGSRSDNGRSGGRPSGRSQGGNRSRGPQRSADRNDRPQRAAAAPTEPQIKEIELPEQITLRELADLLNCSPIELIKQLMNAGVMANINQQLDYDTAAIVAEDMGFTVKEQEIAEPEPTEEEDVSAPQKVQRRVYSEEEQKYLRTRPPVVTILGHVDHGKTSLLDVIRRTNVQAGEAGGITQHIGAYQVTVQDDKAITFLDTPGHEAFTAMRARGAGVTDIAVLVVAADDGVQPQTREAISHARAAQVPIIVAINKIDLPTANPEFALQQLSELGLVPEEWGGDTICVPVSAKTQENIDTLLDMILLVAEMADLKANPRADAEGVVIEGRMDRSRGATATLLVQEGTLKVGDALVIGNTYGKIRAMSDYQGKTLKRATPSTPAVVIGLRDVPAAGDTFQVVENEREARERAEIRAEASAVTETRSVAMSLDDIYAQVARGDVQELNLILKVDVQGSIEPIKNSLEKLDIGDIKVRFIHQGVGNVAESDVMLAVASGAVVVGFSVGVDAAAQRLAETEGIEVRTYDIIYRLIEDVQRALTGMLEPEYQEVERGQAVVRQVFSLPRRGNVAGVQVIEGKALRNAMVRVKRGDKVLWQGRVSSLKRYTEDVREVNTGMECGVGLDGFNDFEPDDIFEFYTREVVQRSAA
ncbi:MAG: translation initiation factor IF-2 [Anaerolineae bacterium]|jgi:translation initiation factor IF-2